MKERTQVTKSTMPKILLMRHLSVKGFQKFKQILQNAHALCAYYVITQAGNEYEGT